VGHFVDSNRAFDGQIDQIKVWNGVLTASQVRQSMNALGAEGIASAPTLRAHYDFNNGSGSVIYDRAGSANLNVVGSPTFADVKTSTVNGEPVVASPKTYLPGFTPWSAISLVHAAPASIELTSTPASVKAGIASSAGFGLRVLDAFGNLVTDWSRGSWATTSPSLTMTYLSATSASPSVSSTVNVTALISTVSGTTRSSGSRTRLCTASFHLLWFG
jgi:hypothetical protein